MALPIAAIICIVLACWAVLILILFAVYQVLKNRGTCGCECAPCGKSEDTSSCTCCQTLSDSCNCCNPSIDGCLDCVCPSGKKKVSCVDILLCQCTASPGEESCCVKIFCCCNYTCCDIDECCSCCVDCEGVVCCCLEIRLVSKTVKQPAPDKYTVSSSNKNNNNSIDKKFSSVKNKTEIVTQKKQTHVASPSMTPPATPPTERSVRSVSQLVLSTDSKLSKRKTVKSTSKSNRAKNTSTGGMNKPVKSVNKNAQSVSKVKTATSEHAEGTRNISRSLPLPPGGRKNLEDSKKSGASRSRPQSSRYANTASELVEVPVTRSDVPVHLGSWLPSPRPGGSDLNLSGSSSSTIMPNVDHHVHSSAYSSAYSSQQWGYIDGAVSMMATPGVMGSAAGGNIVSGVVHQGVPGAQGIPGNLGCLTKLSLFCCPVCITSGDIFSSCKEGTFCSCKLPILQCLYSRSDAPTCHCPKPAYPYCNCYPENITKCLVTSRDGISEGLSWMYRHMLCCICYDFIMVHRMCTCRCNEACEYECEKCYEPCSDFPCCVCARCSEDQSLGHWCRYELCWEGGLMQCGNCVCCRQDLYRRQYTFCTCCGCHFRSEDHLPGSPASDRSLDITTGLSCLKESFAEFGYDLQLVGEDGSILKVQGPDNIHEKLPKYCHNVDLAVHKSLQTLAEKNFLVGLKGSRSAPTRFQRASSTFLYESQPSVTGNFPHSDLGLDTVHEIDETTGHRFNRRKFPRGVAESQHLESESESELEEAEQVRAKKKISERLKDLRQRSQDLGSQVSKGRVTHTTKTGSSTSHEGTSHDTTYRERQYNRPQTQQPESINKEYERKRLAESDISMIKDNIRGEQVSDLDKKCAIESSSPCFYYDAEKSTHEQACSSREKSGNKFTTDNSESPKRIRRRAKRHKHQRPKEQYSSENEQNERSSKPTAVDSAFGKNVAHVERSADNDGLGSVTKKKKKVVKKKKNLSIENSHKNTQGNSISISDRPLVNDRDVDMRYQTVVQDIESSDEDTELGEVFPGRSERKLLNVGAREAWTTSLEHDKTSNARKYLKFDDQSETSDDENAWLVEGASGNRLSVSGSDSSNLFGQLSSRRLKQTEQRKKRCKSASENQRSQAKADQTLILPFGQRNGKSSDNVTMATIALADESELSEVEGQYLMEKHEVNKAIDTGLDKTSSVDSRHRYDGNIREDHVKGRSQNRKSLTIKHTNV